MEIDSVGRAPELPASEFLALRDEIQARLQAAVSLPGPQTEAELRKQVEKAFVKQMERMYPEVPVRIPEPTAEDVGGRVMRAELAVPAWLALRLGLVGDEFSEDKETA